MTLSFPQKVQFTRGIARRYDINIKNESEYDIENTSMYFEADPLVFSSVRTSIEGATGECLNQWSQHVVVFYTTIVGGEASYVFPAGTIRHILMQWFVRETAPIGDYDFIMSLKGTIAGGPGILAGNFTTAIRKYQCGVKTVRIILAEGEG